MYHFSTGLKPSVLSVVASMLIVSTPAWSACSIVSGQYVCNGLTALTIDTPLTSTITDL